jgi:hypothetical protein
VFRRQHGGGSHQPLHCLGQSYPHRCSLDSALCNQPQPPPCSQQHPGKQVRGQAQSLPSLPTTNAMVWNLARSDVPLPTTAVDDRRVERPLRRQAASISAALALALRDILRARAQERVDGSRLRRRSRRRRVHSHRPLRRSRSPRARRRLVAARQASSSRARQPPQWHFTSISSPRPTHAQARRPSRRIA